MSTFQRITPADSTQTYLHFLYVGPTGDRRDGIIAAAKAMGCFEEVDAISVGELRSEDHRTIGGVAVAHGCLVVVWDLTDDWIGQEFADAIGELPFRELASPQRAIFGLSETGQSLSFREFTLAIASNFVGLGTTQQCVDTLRRWCLGGGAPGRSSYLGLHCPKAPALWIRNIRHDYFGNAISLDTGKELVQAGLWDVQRAIDFWQDALRNVLVFPDTNSPARRYVAVDRDSESELVRRVRQAPLRVVAPRGLEPAFAECGWAAGVDYSLYDTPQELRTCLEIAGRDGCARVLVREPSLQLDVTPVDGAHGHTPVIIVGGQELRTIWENWPRLLSQNVLGSFSTADFLRLETGKPLPGLKADYWRPFCFLPLRDAMDQIVDMMVSVYETLEQRLEEPKRLQSLTAVYRCVAQVECAKALYFGSA